MSWSEFYLGCFLFGFGLSALALLAGSAHLHLPHLHLQHGIHVPSPAQSGAGPRGAELPWFNLGTIAAFLAWFGGTGYLVDDPEGFQNELISDLGALEDKLDLWLVSGAERFARDADLHHALLTIARHADSRMCLVLLGTILENPGLAERLMEVLRPAAEAPARAEQKTRRRI